MRRGSDGVRPSLPLAAPAQANGVGRDERRLKEVAQKACGSFDGLRACELEIDAQYVSLDASVGGVADFVVSRRTEAELPGGGVLFSEGGQYLGFLDCGGSFFGVLSGRGGGAREAVFFAIVKGEDGTPEE